MVALANPDQCVAPNSFNLGAWTPDQGAPHTLCQSRHPDDPSPKGRLRKLQQRVDVESGGRGQTVLVSADHGGG